MIRNSKGQAFVESIGAGIILIAAISYIFLSIVMETTKLSASHILYEALICSQKLNLTTATCMWNAKKELQNLSLGGKLISFSYSTQPTVAQAWAIFEFPVRIKFIEALSLPIQTQTIRPASK